jgi:hypothetical protein
MKRKKSNHKTKAKTTWQSPITMQMEREQDRKIEIEIEDLIYGMSDVADNAETLQEILDDLVPLMSEIRNPERKMQLLAQFFDTDSLLLDACLESNDMDAKEKLVFAYNEMVEEFEVCIEDLNDKGAEKHAAFFAEIFMGIAETFELKNYGIGKNDVLWTVQSRSSKEDPLGLSQSVAKSLGADHPSLIPLAYAREDLDELVRLLGKQPEPWPDAMLRDLAEIYSKQKQYGKALETLQKIAIPNQIPLIDESVLENIVDCLEELGRKDETLAPAKELAYKHWSPFGFSKWLDALPPEAREKEAAEYVAAQKSGEYFSPYAMEMLERGWTEIVDAYISKGLGDDPEALKQEISQQRLSLEIAKNNPFRHLLPKTPKDMEARTLALLERLEAHKPT